MARPKYMIGPTDLAHSLLYLADRIQLQYLDVSSVGRREFSEIKLIQATDARATRKAQAEALNTWCEQNLSTAEWQKLKSAIRKRRHRQQTANEQIAITISRRAHKILSKLAKRDGVTLMALVDRLVSKKRA
jgi:macrodomain Ter protein organizer (MatP/YcbG family)